MSAVHFLKICNQKSDFHKCMVFYIMLKHESIPSSLSQLGKSQNFYLTPTSYLKTFSIILFCMVFSFLLNNFYFLFLRHKLSARISEPSQRLLQHKTKNYYKYCKTEAKQINNTLKYMPERKKFNKKSEIENPT